MADWKIGPHLGTLVILPKPGATTPGLLVLGGMQVSAAGSDTAEIAGRKRTTVWTWKLKTTADKDAIAEWAEGVHGNGPFDVVAPELGTGTRLMNITAFDPGARDWLGLWSPVMALRDVAVI